MRTGNPGHLETFDYLGLHRYSLTFCTDHRRHLFVRDDVVDLAMRQISRAAAENEFSIITYCFMPDHLHLLVEGQSDSSDGKHFVARAKQYTGYYHKKEFNEVLWQRYGFEHVLRDDEITMVVARYILMNPVRAGLVQKPQDYRYSGSSVYTMEQLLEAVGSA